MRPRCGEFFAGLTMHGRMLTIVDQPASICALATAVARDMGIGQIHPSAHWSSALVSHIDNPPPDHRGAHQTPY